MNFPEFVSRFAAYADAYRAADGSMPDAIQCKYEHTFDVVRFARDIASRENFPAEDLFLAALCGLFHDIARFEQVKRFNTFNDKLSGTVFERNTDCVVNFRQIAFRKFDIQNGANNLGNLTDIICHRLFLLNYLFIFLTRNNHASYPDIADAPAIISVSSCVMEPWRALLYFSVKSLIISSALLVAESIACILAPFSLAAASTSAP